MAQMVVRAEARKYFELGVFQAAEISRVPMSSAWAVTFQGRKGETFVLATVRGDVRHFVTLDAALVTVEAVGFRVAAIRLECSA